MEPPCAEEGLPHPPERAARPWRPADEALRRARHSGGRPPPALLSAARAGAAVAFAEGFALAGVSRYGQFAE
ncbi:hypothetical protein ABZ461_13455 [Actinacidiphila glaucinigra]|uniref:hypothetical protein n=1 Tax=Actinacidiphila glaucinigra TaxID=235986 RepID=UPI0033F2B226